MGACVIRKLGLVSASAVALALAASGVCLGQTKPVIDDSVTFSSRKDNKDGSSALTFGTKLPTTVETKLGVDLGVPPPPPGAIPDPDQLLPGSSNNERNSGAG